MSGQRGHLRKSGGVWRVQFRVAAEPGKPRRLTSRRLGTIRELPTAAAARRAADRLLRQVVPQTMHAGAAVPWPEWCQIYTERHLILLARGSRATRASIVAKHLAHAVSLESLAVHEIDERAVQAFVTDQHRSGAAASTVRARFALLRKMLRTAQAAGLAVTSPRADRITFPRDEVVHANVRARAFSPAEVAAILETAPDPLRAACALARYAGLRCGEVLGLAWPAVDLDTGRLDVRQQALGGEIRPLKCKSSSATLTAPAPLRERLRAYRQAWQPNPRQLLFADATGQPLDAAALRRELHDLLDRLAIPRKGMHGFRHAAALAMAAAGVNPEALRRAMRHSSLRTTAVYLSASSTDVADALAAAASDAGMMRDDGQLTRVFPTNPANTADLQVNK